MIWNTFLFCFYWYEQGIFSTVKVKVRWVKNGTNRKILPQGIHCNMTAGSLLVQKLWPRLTLKSTSKVKVTGSNYFDPTKRSYHMVNICIIRNLNILWFKRNDQGTKKLKKVKRQGQGHWVKMLVPAESSSHKEYTCTMKSPILYFSIHTLWLRLSFCKDWRQERQTWRFLYTLKFVCIDIITDKYTRKTHGPTTFIRCDRFVLVLHLLDSSVHVYNILSREYFL